MVACILVDYLFFLALFVCIQHTISVVTLFCIRSIIQRTISVVSASKVTPILNDGLPLKFALFSYLFCFFLRVFLFENLRHSLHKTLDVVCFVQSQTFGKLIE